MAFGGFFSSEFDRSRVLLELEGPAADLDELELEACDIEVTRGGGVCLESALPLGKDAALFSALYLSSCRPMTVF